MNSRREQSTLDPEFLDRVEQLFHLALSLGPTERVAYLREAKAIEPEIVAEVESLIAEHEQTGSFLNKPAIRVATEDTEQQNTDVSPLRDDDSQSLIDRVIGRYKIERRIPGGGMGKLYLAHDTRLGGLVALKLLPPEYTTDEELLQRFKLEARAARALNHPNILTIYELGEEDGIHFIAAEYVEGTTLRDRISGGPMPLKEAVDAAFQVATALDAVHRLGIIHRDIKPENIMLRQDGIVKVLDFGVVKLVENSQVLKQWEKIQKKLPADWTVPGSVVGTPHYMSPEQITALDLDVRTDIFSLGVVMYEMLTGRPPFKGASFGDLAASILRDEPSPLTQHSTQIPVELDRVVSKALRKDRNERYQTADELARDLKSVVVALPRRPAPDHKKHESIMSDQALAFAEIAIYDNNECWTGGHANRNIANTARGDFPFDWECDYEFVSSSMRRREPDPRFDITVINTRESPILLTAVGVEFVRMGVAPIPHAEATATSRETAPKQLSSFLAQILKWAGEARVPKSVKVKRDGDYSVKISEIFPIILPDDFKRSWESFDSARSIELDHVVVESRLPDPIYLQREAPHRFGLLLADYCKHMPQHIVLRVFAQTNHGKSKSATIYLRKSSALRPGFFYRLLSTGKGELYTG